jgi:hypothetical protein
MRAILIKELRENLKWAMLMLLALAAALAYAVHADAPRGLSLVGSTMVMVSAIAFPVIGFALGLLQILQDRGVGRWGFLTHRPLSRTRIFVAKVVAGLLLYGLASAIPLAAAIFWVATPGHLAAPFDWYMALPRFSDLLGGIVWYSTGLLVASRQARWIGSRLMPMGLALLVSIFAWVFPFALWQAALIIGAGVAILLPAALTTFDAGGVFERQPAITRFLQVLSVGTGMTMFVGTLTGMLIGAIESGRPSRPSEYQGYRIDPDGEIVCDTYNAGGLAESTDLEGRPAAHIGNGPNQPGALSVGFYLQGFASNQLDWSARREHEGLQNPDSYIFRLGQDGSTQWFYVTSRRTIEGFDSISNRFVGSIGPDGFLPASQPPEPFHEPLYPYGNSPGPENWGLSEASRTTAYRLDLPRRQIGVVFKTTADDPLLAAPRLLIPSWGAAPLMIAATRSRIHVLNGRKELFSVPLEHTYPGYQSLTVAHARSDRFTFFYQNWLNSAQNPNWVIETDAKGQIIHRISLPLLVVATSSEPRWAEALLACVLPPFALIVPAREKPALLTILAVCCVGLASAAAAAALCRRYAFKGSAVLLWAAFGLITGIPGILTLLAVRHLPARVACPHCARQRVVNRETCEHCGEPFAAPPLEQIEVFEAA